MTEKRACYNKTLDGITLKWKQANKTEIIEESTLQFEMIVWIACVTRNNDTTRGYNPRNINSYNLLSRSCLSSGIFIQSRRLQLLDL